MTEQTNHCLNVHRFVMSLVLWLLIGLQPTWAGTSGTACMMDVTGFGAADLCDGNEVRTSGFEVIAGPTHCKIGETITVTLKAKVESRSQQNDIGLWIDEQGGNAKDSGNVCFRDYLNPVSANNLDINLAGGTGPFYNGEKDVRPGDICGDVPSPNTWLNAGDIGSCSSGGGICVFSHYTFEATVECADSDANKIADVGSCTSWDISNSLQCGVAGSPELETMPDDAARCSCGTTDIGVPIFQPNPRLTLNKDSSTINYNAVGDAIDYTYFVTNSGNVALAGPVTVTDDKTTVICPSGDLDLGESINCTASYSVIQADINTGEVLNIATAFADSTTSNSDQVTVPAIQTRRLTLDKDSATANYDAVDDVIHYTYLVTNSGNLPLDGPVTIMDDRTTGTCPDGNLEPGKSISCTANYIVTQADLDAGEVLNIATASADGTTSNSDQVTVPAVQTRRLTLDKSSSTASYDAVGDSIDYTYIVTNSGNISLVGPVAITDDKVTVTCPSVTSVGDGDGKLNPGESLTCTASDTVTQAIIDAGNVQNIATASADGITSNQDQVIVLATQNHALTLDKDSSTVNYDAVGDVIDYTYQVTNSGNVSLAGPVTIVDDKSTVICPAVTSIGNGDGNLNPGESLTCSSSYTVIQADIDSGDVLTTATASADGTISNPDQGEVPAVQTRRLTLDKDSSTPNYDAVDDVINYTYLVINSGNIFLAGPVVVTDDRTTATCPPKDLLGPGEIISCTASYTVTQVDIDDGEVTNIATATADGTISNQDLVTVPAVQNRALTLDKGSTTASYDTVGDIIIYTYLVSNSGNVSLAGPVTVTDGNAAVNCPAVTAVGNGDGKLNLGEQLVCTASYGVTQADIDASKVQSFATAFADGGVSNQDQVIVPAVPNRGLILEKNSAEVGYDAVGDVINYTYLVTNSGNISLTGPVTITDGKVAATCPAVAAVGDLDGKLNPGENLTCTGSYTIIQADIDAGNVQTTATASADGTTSNQDQVNVPLAPTPIPLLVPFGLFSTFLGLSWIGFRRQSM